MEMDQYEAYYLEFVLKIPAKPTNNRGLRVIGVQVTVIGETLIEIPFAALGMIFEVDISIFQENAT